MSNLGPNDVSTNTITKTILFRCVEISDVNEISASDDRKIVHFKGFAERLHSLQPPSDFIEHLRAFDILAWDGDVLQHDSFTKYLIACLTDEPTPRLLAYRLRFQEIVNAATDGSQHTITSPFLDAWDNIIATISYPTLLHNDTVANITQQITFGRALQGVQHDRECIIYYKQLDADPVANRQFDNRYLELAIKALKDSGSTAIVCAGGGNGIKAEFNYIQQRLNEEYTWSAWPLTRLTPDRQRFEECFFTQLRGEGHSHAAK
eukprot:gene25251-32949_t